VLPVFVLSLQRPGRPPLIDGEHLFAATKDAVVVVQHGDEVSVPFFAATQQLTLKADNPSPSILAGILTSLGAVAPPSQRYSRHHEKVVKDQLFAHGASPFGPFASSLELSHILVDHSVRNAVLWRVDSAVEEGHTILLELDAFANRYLFDPLGDRAERNKQASRWLDALALGDEQAVVPSLAHSAATNTMRQLHSAMIELEEDLAAVSELLYSAHIKEAFHKSEVCLRKALDLQIRTRRQLRSAENALGCCSLTHSVVFRTEGVHYLRAVLAGIIAVSGVLLLTLRDPEKRRRVQTAAASRLRSRPEKQALD